MSGYEFLHVLLSLVVLWGLELASTELEHLTSTEFGYLQYYGLEMRQEMWMMQYISCGYVSIVVISCDNFRILIYLLTYMVIVLVAYLAS